MEGTSEYGLAPTIASITSDHYHQILGGIRGNVLTVENGERRPDTGEVYWSPVRAYSTPYTVHLAHGRFSEHIFVVGEYGANRSVLERWKILPVPGSFTVDRPEQSAPIGVPVGLNMDPALVVSGGGDWIAPGCRTGQPLERRVLIDDSLIGAPIAEFAVDPDGRYIVYIGTNPSGVYMRKAVGSTSDESDLLFNALDIPDVDQARTIEIYHHAQLGRTLVIGFCAKDLSRRVLLADGDKGGVFDSPVELTYAEYVILVIDDAGVVFENYTDYVFWRERTYS